MMMALTLLLACSGSDGGVAASVNGRDIPLSRVQSALQTVADSPIPQREASVRMLDRLIDQELLVQAALRARLDRDPQVREAIEASRRQVLAQSYVDRSVAGVGDGAGDEVRAYYLQNPALFAERRIYRFRELAVEGPSEKLAGLATAATSPAGMEELGQWLRARKLPFTAATATKPAEQLPFTFLPRLARMKDGERVVFPTASGASVLELVESQASPLSESQAAPVIERFLESRRRVQMADEAIARLRRDSIVEYRGPFRTGWREGALRASNDARAPGGAPREGDRVLQEEMGPVAAVAGRATPVDARIELPGLR